MTSTTDRARLIGFVAASGARRAVSRIANTFAGGLPFDGRAPARLLIAPHDLRTADPTIAADIYRGRFSLSGTAVEIGAISPFAMEPPSAAWEAELLGFSWLRHFHAADDAVSRVHARALIGDWIAVQGRGHPVGWQPQVLARRIISWLSHSPVYLAHADPDFYRLVMRSLGRQLRYLARHVNSAPDGVPRLTAHIAMAYATLCVSGLERLQIRAMRLLAAELDRQVLPDGGHFSRHPGANLDLLLDLLPLRQTFLSRDIAPPQSLIGAIDRMIPMVRFFRHGDGSFGLFNGMGRTQGGVVSAILAYDESRGRPPEQAPHSGYQRLEAGSSIILIDTGRPPPSSVSHAAHAGCLSFEFSSGTQRIITNCGGGTALKEEWRQAARATAAHSTVVVANSSSARFVTGEVLTRLFGTPVISGPNDVVSARHDNDEDLVVECRHDGYRRLGIIHHRRIVMSRDGLVIEGQDRLTRSSTLFSRTRAFSMRFHLHPSVRATVSQDSRSVTLAMQGSHVWRLSVFGASIRLEESVYLADPKGARRTEQIVISGQCGNEALIRWSLRRDGAERAPRVREVREGERDEQVLPQTVDTGVGIDTEPAEDDGTPSEPETAADTSDATPVSQPAPPAGTGKPPPESNFDAKASAERAASATQREPRRDAAEDRAAAGRHQARPPSPSRRGPTASRDTSLPRMPDTPLDGDPGEPPAFRSLATPRPKSAAPPTADTAPASERREPSFGRGSGGETPPPDGGEGGRIEPSLGAPPPSDAAQEKTADAGPDSDDGGRPDDRDPEDRGGDTDDDRR